MVIFKLMFRFLFQFVDSSEMLNHCDESRNVEIQFSNLYAKLQISNVLIRFG